MINGAFIRPVSAWRRSDDVDQAIFARSDEAVFPRALASYAAAIAFLAREVYEENVAKSP